MAREDIFAQSALEEALAGARRARGVTAFPQKTDALSLELDWRGRRAFLDGREVPLSPREYDLLSAFASHPGEALSHEQLYLMVWGKSPEGPSKALNVAVTRLRRKLGDSFPIASLYGFGYRYDPLV